MCMHTCRGQRLAPDIFLDYFLSCWRHTLSRNPRTHHLSLCLQQWVMGACLECSGFCGFQEFKPMSACLCDKRVMTKPSLQSKVVYLKKKYWAVSKFSGAGKRHSVALKGAVEEPRDVRFEGSCPWFFSFMSSGGSLQRATEISQPGATNPLLFEIKSQWRIWGRLT